VKFRSIVTVRKVLDDARVNMLDGEAIEVAGVGFAGIAGFGRANVKRMGRTAH
jgi:hypothetical protein